LSTVLKGLAIKLNDASKWQIFHIFSNKMFYILDCSAGSTEQQVSSVSQSSDYWIFSVFVKHNMIA